MNAQSKNVYDFFSSQISKLVHSFESLSLNTRHGLGVVHFTMLARIIGWYIEDDT